MKKLKKIFLFLLIIVVASIVALWVYKNIIFPRRYKNSVEKAAELYNVDPNLVYAVIKQESKFNANAVSVSGAKGLMQLVDTTANEISRKIDSIDDNDYNIFDPYTNILIGTKYLSYLINYFDGNYYIALAAYNAGMGKVEKWLTKPYDDYKNYVDIIDEIEYNETRNYLTNVITYYDYYTKLYK